jgi:cytochrome P450
MKFDPERFRSVPSTVARLDCGTVIDSSRTVLQVPAAGTYAPFGAGPRMCIGNRMATLELKATLAHLVRKYKFALDPACPLEIRTHLTVVPRHGVRLFVTKRG